MVIMEKNQQAHVDKVIALIDVVVANVALKNAVIQLAIVEEDQEASVDAIIAQDMVVANLELEITTYPHCMTMEAKVEKQFVMVEKNV